MYKEEKGAQLLNIEHVSLKRSLEEEEPKNEPKNGIHTGRKKTRGGWFLEIQKIQGKGSRQHIPCY